MIRFLLLTGFVAGAAVYAWKDWYKSLCALIVLMAVVEHPDMPKSMFGMQGLNPWNLLLIIVVAAWLTSRRREGLSWDMPRHVTVLLVLYLGVVLVGFVRMQMDPAGLDESPAAMMSEYLVNTVKWVIPGLLLFDGCRDRSRFLLGLGAVLAVYFLLGLQVIRWMPPSAAISGEELGERSLKILLNEIGYHRVNLSMMLAGASWAVFAIRPLSVRPWQSWTISLATLALVYAQALTAGRMGYVTWMVVGLLLCLIRWRKYLLLVPTAALIVILVVPGAVERMAQGFTPETMDNNTQIAYLLDSGDGRMDAYTITAGRNVAWPLVQEKIAQSPLTGYGRQGMVRTGIVAFLRDQFGEVFGHPHNAYLEFLLDNGWLGALLVFPFYIVILWHAIALFRDQRSPACQAIGGVVCALVFALLIAAMGSQTFYPREGAVGMWCAIGLMLRVLVERGQPSAAPLTRLATPGVATARP